MALISNPNYADRPSLYIQDVWEHSRIIMRGQSALSLSLGMMETISLTAVNSYDDLWEVERKLYHMFLNSNIVSKYLPYQSLETKRLCLDLLESPESFVDHVGRTTTSISTSMTYGFRVDSASSPALTRLFENAHDFFKLLHGSQYLDWYPVL